MQIFNTEGKQLQEFEPINPGKVGFYQCGPTVYWTQHIGNMRAMVIADLMRRSLEYLGYEVNFVRNYTDVGHLTGDNIGDADSGEDRMQKAARRENLSPDEIAQKYIDQFETDLVQLNIKPATSKPRATEYVEQMISMVESLIEKGYAYETDEAVYFDVSQMEGYTKLSGQQLDQNISGAGHGKVEHEYKRGPHDFALWFFKTGPHANALQTWKSPFRSTAVENGEGFPGWHIECSAMSKAEIGDTIDIHMGGIEHIPVHHTNEIAQSEAANGAKFVNYWLHNEHLLVDGAKMAKSEGTTYSVGQVKEKGYDPLALRYFFLQSHYRSKQNFTWEALQGAQKALDNLRANITSAKRNLLDNGDEVKPVGKILELWRAKFAAAIEIDFNFPKALAVIWELFADKTISSADLLTTVASMDEVLGLNLMKYADKYTKTEKELPTSYSPEVEKLIDQRKTARANKDWKTADQIRDQLIEEYGIKLTD
jgi:cysteinyl-tRNA synthetase